MPFCEKTLDFLFQNKINDSRAWFEANRGDYITYVIDPMRSLTAQMAPVMAAIDPLIVCDGRIGRSISRIHRDTRFSRDKSRYRMSVWLSLGRDKHDFACRPSFFFEVRPQGLMWGCGWYKAERDMLECARDMIGRKEPSFKRADGALKKRSDFILSGDSYKRTRFPGATDRQRLWGDKKELCVLTASDDFAPLFSGNMAGVLERDYKDMADIYAFYIAAYERARKEALIRAEFEAF